MSECIWYSEEVIGEMSGKACEHMEDGRAGIREYDDLLEYDDLPAIMTGL